MTMKMIQLVIKLVKLILQIQIFQFYIIIIIIYNLEDYITQNNQKSVELYENNDFKSIIKFKSAPLRPPPPVIKSHSPILKPQEQYVNISHNSNNDNIIKPTNREFKKHEFKSNFDNKNNKIDFDQFLNKVMNDALIELSSNNNNNSKKEINENKNKKNPFFYSQQTLIQNERLLPLEPSSFSTIDNTSTNNNQQKSNFTNLNNHHHLYENFNSDSIKKTFF